MIMKYLLSSRVISASSPLRNATLKILLSNLILESTCLEEIILDKAHFQELETQVLTERKLNFGVPTASKAD